MKAINLILVGMLLLASCGQESKFRITGERFSTVNKDGKIDSTYNHDVVIRTDVYELKGDTVIVMNSNKTGWIIYEGTVLVER